MSPRRHAAPRKTPTLWVKRQWRVLSKNIGRYPLGVWFALVGLCSLVCAWGMQAYSLVDWNGAVDLGLQNERFTGDPAEQAWALESWGVAAADMLWGVPVTVIAIAGVLRLRLVGFAAGLMAFSIGTYFPIVFAFQRWRSHPDTVVAALVLFVMPSLLGIIGLWANRDSFWKKHRRG